MKNTLSSSRGNAMLISIVLTGFVLFTATGALTIIRDSTRNIPRAEKSTKSFFAAESALENALYNAAEHDSGWMVPENTPEAFLDFSAGDSLQATGKFFTENIRSAPSNSAEVSSLGVVYTPALPSGKEGLTGWRKMGFGEVATFDLFADADGMGTDGITLESALKSKTSDLLILYQRKIDRLSLLLSPQKRALDIASRDAIQAKIANYQQLMANINSGGAIGTLPRDTKSLFDSDGTVSNIFIDLFIPALRNEIHKEPPVQIAFDVQTGTISVNNSGSITPVSLSGAGTEYVFGNKKITFLPCYDVACGGKGVFKVRGERNFYVKKNAHISFSGNERHPLLSWSASGSLLDYGGIPISQNITGALDCTKVYNAALSSLISNRAGGICFLDKDNGRGFNAQNIENIQMIEYQEGTYIRLKNPLGNYTATSGDMASFSVAKGARVQGTLLDFFEKGTQTMKKPRLSLRIGSPLRTTSGNTLPAVYVRVGLQVGVGYGGDIFLTNDHGTITAVGETDGFQRSLSVKFPRKEVAPIFDYAILQD